MEYEFGYVAFIDILGFSNLVLDENNIEIVDKLLHFVNNFQYLFNNSAKLNLRMAFFSDSIVLTTNDQESDSLPLLLTAIHLAELELYEDTGLYFRGGITKGKYYYSNTTVFGPAIVKAYQLELQAKYCRIIFDSDLFVDHTITNKHLKRGIEIIQDFDGEYYYNIFYNHIHDNTPAGRHPTIEEAFKSYSSLREETVNSIKEHLQTNVIDKYLWRGTAFNRNIKLIKRIFKRLKIEYQENDIVRFQNLYIDIDSLNE